MNQTTRDSCLPLAPILLAPFRERFIKDGNVYDEYNQTKFSVEEKEALIKKHPFLTKLKCYDFAKNAYVHHPGENAFRAYIGVPLSHDTVSLVPSRAIRHCKNVFGNTLPYFFAKNWYIDDLHENLMKSSFSDCAGGNVR